MLMIRAHVLCPTRGLEKRACGSTEANGGHSFQRHSSLPRTVRDNRHSCGTCPPCCLGCMMEERLMHHSTNQSLHAIARRRQGGHAHLPACKANSVCASESACTLVQTAAFQKANKCQIRCMQHANGCRKGSRRVHKWRSLTDTHSRRSCFSYN